MKYLDTIILFILSMILMTAAAFGADQLAVPGQDVADKILAFLSSASGQSVVIGMIVEFVLRFSKSDKPLSLAYLIVGVIKMVAQVLEVIASFLDKILPQRLK